jgi:YVTN family beta-propeller protein
MAGVWSRRNSAGLLRRTLVATCALTVGCGGAAGPARDAGAPEASSPGGPSDAWDGSAVSEAGEPAGDADTAQDGDSGSDAPADAALPPRTAAADFTGTVDGASFATLTTTWSRALATTAALVVTANPESDSITVLDSATPPRVRTEIAVGRDPRSVAVTPDGRYAAVVNRGDATLSIVDLAAGRELYYFETRPLPYAAVIAGGRVVVSEWATGEVAAFDPVGRSLAARAAVGPYPAGLAHCGPPRCALAAGRGLLVSHFYSGRLTQLDPVTLAPVAVVETGADANLAQHVAIAPDGRRAYLPETRSFADNPTRQFDTTVFPVVNVVDLATFTLLNSARITLDTADRPVALPFAVDFLADGRLLAVANAGSDDLSIIDLQTGRKAAHLDVGANPQAVAAAPDGRTLYVNEILAGQLRAIQIGSDGTLGTAGIVATTALPLLPEILRGKRLFWTAARADLTRDRWMSCATCHFDGLHDARTWRSFPDGVRNTTALYDLADTAPLHWSGDLDELEDVEATIRFVQAGTGLAPAPRIDTLGEPLAGASADLAALAAFLRTLRPPASPYAASDPPAISRGRDAFVRFACATCHAGPAFTDRALHDVGTGDLATERNSHGRGTRFDTPSLRALWLTPPYLHDGSAPTLTVLFTRGAHDLSGQATAADVADLVAYLRAL